MTSIDRAAVITARIFKGVNPMFGKKYLLATVLAAAPLAVHAAETVYTFDSVSSIEHTGTILITGILVNDATPTTLTLPPWGEASMHRVCERLFELMLTEPGTYTLTVATNTGEGSSGTYTFFTRCKAERKP